MDENGINLKELLKESTIVFIMISLYFLLTGKHRLFYGLAIGQGMYIVGIYHLAHITAQVLSLHVVHAVIAKPLAVISFGMRYGVAAIVFILVISNDLMMFYGVIIGIVAVILVIMTDSLVCSIRNYINMMIH